MDETETKLQICWCALAVLTYIYTAADMFRTIAYWKDDLKWYCLLVQAKEQYNVLFFGASTKNI